jgi:hypothetical protein
LTWNYQPSMRSYRRFQATYPRVLTLRAQIRHKQQMFEH